MTTRERILALADQGMTFPLIAAILDITPEQVEEGFLGGEIQGVPFVPSLCFQVHARQKIAQDWPIHGEVTVAAYATGADGPKPDTPNGTITLGPVALKAGGAFYHKLQMHHSLTASLLAAVVSADGTQVLQVSTFELPGSEYPSEAEVANSGPHKPWAEAFEVVGTHLSLDEEGEITTDVDGLYYCTTIAYIEPAR